MILDNNIENIKIYDRVGINRIFIDLEINGKKERQGHLDTVISSHSLDDIKNIKPILKNSELLVRVNPIYENSVYEINKSMENGADIVMLPMFKTVSEVKLFINYIDKKAKVCLLLETSEALARIDDILEVEGIDEIHIGLNDLHLSLGLDFMFELMGGGLIEYLATKIKAKNIPFGIGGIARMNEGMLQGDILMKEHVRLGSSMVILSRTFKRDLNIDKNIFKQEILKLQESEENAKKITNEELNKNKLLLNKLAKDIAIIIRNKK
jgi:hypothetical protein